MNTLYKTPTTNKSIDRKTGGFVLCHFSHAEDLLFGIDALKSLQIPIQEVYAPNRINELQSRLALKRLKAGHAFLTYGCLGGMAFTSIIGYALDHQGNVPPLLLLSVALAFGLAYGFMPKPPKVFKLPSNDLRFLIVVKTKNIILVEGVASFLQYSGSVEITQAVKKMLLN